ncbi:RidA family protein [Roseivivax halodurans]|nr:RidA family protein [Roseivivax halodurans]
MANRITRLDPADLPDTSAVGYAQISIAQPGRMAFVSGQVASAEAVAQGFETQAADVTQTAMSALAALDATTDDLVMAPIYVIDFDGARLVTTVAKFKAFCDGATRL